MEDYFSREITTIEKELTALKTSIVKSGSTIVADSKSISYRIDLALNQSQTIAFGYAYFKITLNSDAILTISLDKYIDNLNKVFDVGSQTRYINYRLCKLSNNEYVVAIRGNGDANDILTLRNGGNVSLNGILTVICSDSFNLGAI